ncbi:MAG: ATP-binding protein [Bilophila sp.]
MSDKGLPFGLTRFLSWVSLVLILASSILMAFFIGNSAQKTLLLRQQQYALLMAGNLNQQIYRRFTLPTFLAFGRIALRQSMQYQQLDEVVQSTIAGLHVKSLRIYGADNIVNYSTDETELGRTDLTPQAMSKVMSNGVPLFETLSTVERFPSFMLKLPDESYTLRTMFPLTVNLGISEKTGEQESLVTGVLEITQDITADYDTILRFQGLILAACLGSSTILFGLLQFFILKAERILTERMARTRKLEAELHQNEKLASMGRVIASIAHEIRNPLGIIRSSAELLLRRAPAAEPDKVASADRRILSAVYDESCRLSQIVNDFLDYARPRVPRQDSVDLNALLDQALGFLEGEMTRLGVEQVRHVPANLCVLGDKDLLYRAIYNILVNAYQAIEHDGIIRIRGQLREDGCVELTFHDSGPGFPPDQLPRLLDPFFTTKDNGTGLGLPIVNTIITSHSGELKLSNPPEGGAMITVILPVVTDTNRCQDSGKVIAPPDNATDAPRTLV